MGEPLNTLESIRKRRSIKLVSETPLPVQPCDKEFIETLLESAYYAPYHYPCASSHQDSLSSVLPWRFYVLDSAACRQLSSVLVEGAVQAGKLPGMLNSANYLILSTWCPQLSNTSEADSELLFDGDLINMEHIAAAGAAVQNLLLSATALGHENYWGSGGVLRKKEFFDKFGIANEEILIGALFIFPNDSEVGSEVKTSLGKFRNKRGSLVDSYRYIDSSLIK
ncbi:MAG: nitroreductase family protein [Gammaproteobacteria bacterium]|nr:nitroreductase family protein [Gammaproteobacteria bacterium]